MMSRTSPARRQQRIPFGFPRPSADSPQRLLRYWPLDLDVHNRKIEELRSNPFERWLRYLRSLPARGLASVSAAAAAERFWARLSEEVERATPPNASPTDDGGVLMSWTAHGHHVEVEIATSGTYEWFYRHRASDTTDAGVIDDEGLPQELVEHVKQVQG